MYHQFKELADVDITAEPMEVGPTCHYVMGGVEVDPDTEAARGVPGLFAAGEVAGGMHGSNRLGGNSLSDLLVFGRRAGAGAAAYVASVDGARAGRRRRGRRPTAERAALAPFREGVSENPYSVHQELQQTMNDLVGIIRTARDGGGARAHRGARSRAAEAWRRRPPPVQPGLAPGPRSAKHASGERVHRAGGAGARGVPRRAHPRRLPRRRSAQWRRWNLLCTLDADGARARSSAAPLPSMPAELLGLFERKELASYLTDEELPAAGAGEGGA